MVFIGGFQVQQVCEVVVNKTPTDHSWKNKRLATHTFHTSASDLSWKK